MVSEERNSYIERFSYDLEMKTREQRAANSHRFIAKSVDKYGKSFQAFYAAGC